MPIDKQKAARMYAKGMSLVAIAAEFKVSRPVVTRWIQQCGTKTNNYREKEKWAEAERLYVEEKLSTRQIARTLSLDYSGVSKKLSSKGLLRNKSESVSLMARKINGYTGRAGWWQSSKTGKWEPAASRYEMFRMKQLDEDQSVVSWSRANLEFIYAGGKKYIPDFHIYYSDGRQVVEEIKPEFQLQNEKEKAKWAAAKTALGKVGIDFRVVTEKEMGREELKNFRPQGLLHVPEEEEIARTKEYMRAYREKNLEKLRLNAKEQYQKRKLTNQQAKQENP